MEAEQQKGGRKAGDFASHYSHTCWNAGRCVDMIWFKILERGRVVLHQMMHEEEKCWKYLPVTIVNSKSFYLEIAQMQVDVAIPQSLF